MIVFPNAKINLGLNVIERRQDGFHNIESCFYPVPWYDALEIVEAKALKFNSTGLPIPGEGNICIKAFELLQKDFDLPNVSIHLHKNIPIGAGLGGGSADGAFMLKLLNDRFTLGLSNEKLQFYAGQLGSDCPFFIENKPRFVEGTGEIFSSISLDLSKLFIAIIYPEIHVETRAAYQGLKASKPNNNLKSTIENTSIADWRHTLTNDFETHADKRILALKEALYNKGALYASMTGSGSAVFGLFSEEPNLDSDYPKIMAKLNS